MHIDLGSEAVNEPNYGIATGMASSKIQAVGCGRGRECAGKEAQREHEEEEASETGECVHSCKGVKSVVWCERVTVAGEELKRRCVLKEDGVHLL